MTNREIEHPRLIQPIDCFPVEIEGRQLFGLCDPKNEEKECYIYTQAQIFLISLLTGQNTVRDLQYQFMKQFGNIVGTDEIDVLIKRLDEQLLLDSPRYQEHIKHKKEEYNQLSVRPARFWGKSYPKDIDELTELIDSFYFSSKGPGKIDIAKRNKPPIGIVAPHIDFNRGGPGFAHAYKLIAEAEDIELFIILGTDHSETKNFYSISSKDYATPYGNAVLDCEFIDNLKSKLDFDIYEDEYNHKCEHSIEFQVIFLHHLYQTRRPFKIVPILCGSFLEFLYSGIDPQDNEQIKTFNQALHNTISESNKTVCVIAGVDFSHVGLQFGDSQPPSKFDLDSIEAEDRQIIETITNQDRQQMISILTENKNHNNICGVSPLYSLISVIPSQKGKLLYYDFWHDNQAGSMVSFASLVFSDEI